MSIRPDQVAPLLETSCLLGSTADAKVVLSRVADCLRDVLQAERATVFRHDVEAGELVSVVAHGPDGNLDDDLDAIHVPLGQGIAGAAGSRREIVNIPDAYADDRFYRDIDEATGYRTRSILTVPLVAPERDDLIGVAQILNRAGGPFTEDDERLATALAAQCAVAMQRADLVKDHVRLAAVEHALDLARDIQQDTFPTDFASPSGWECGGWSIPAEQTGGDTFDVVNTDTGLHLFVGDATGHGIGPALSASQARSMLRMATRLHTPPFDIIRHLNAQIHADSRSSRFVTAWLGFVQADSGCMVSMAAGQGPLLIVRADGGVEHLNADAPPLGVMPELMLDAPHTLEFGPGDLLAVPTDGIMEATDEAGDYGEGRLVDLLRTNRAQALDVLLEAVRADTMDFHQGREAADDRTILVVRRTANGR